MLPEVDGADPLAPHSLSASELKALLAAEREGQPLLVYRDGAGALALRQLERGAAGLTLGRGADMDLRIDWDPEVSGVHAELRRAGGEWAILDDGLSRNGTYVNGRRISGRQRLRDEDRIRLGQTVIAFKGGDSATAIDETVPASQTAIPQQLTESQRRVLVALCRPYQEGTSFTRPATNQEIAAEVFLSVDAVKMHLRALFAKFELAELPQNEKRVRLAESALQFGVVTQRDLA
jgi:pSer/pThr/pTyr-binding forkhead associated (FHA) protein